MTEKAFQVDLRGVVDLLSHHLYSSPRVYVRELVQNAVDAVTARARLGQPAEAAAAPIVLVPADVSPDGRLHCLDPGVGLTEEEVGRFLATIGSSSKRDELGLPDADFIGRFGIGLLSCFLVADEIALVTRSASAPQAGCVRWTGSANGSYTVAPVPAGQPVAPVADARLAAGLGPLPAVDVPGSWVSLRPRRGASDWTSTAQVLALAREFGEMLPVPLAVLGADGVLQQVTGGVRPWEDAPEPERVQRAAQLLGVRPLAAFDVRVDAAGLRGVAIVPDRAGSPTAPQAHRAYAHGMLVGEGIDGLLPPWAFFVRCVVDGRLRLTAAREGLYEDDLLLEVREELGAQVRGWITRTLDADPATFERFLRVHASAIKAVAAHDDDLLRLLLPWLAFETTAGPLTLPEVAQRFGVVRWTHTVEEFRQVAPVAAAQGLGVVDAGYSHDADLIERYAALHPDVVVATLRPGDLDAHVRSPDAAALAALAGFLTAARATLAPLDVAVELREFDPITLPALVLDDREARHRRTARAEAAAAVDDVWASLIKAVDDGGDDRRRLLLNHANALVRKVAGITDERLRALAVESLYCQALLAGRHPMRPAENATLTRSFAGLLDKAMEER
ncbi:MAG: HSP90 family protein [Kineosporiaceae bacterium]